MKNNIYFLLFHVPTEGLFPWKLISSSRESSSEHPLWGLMVENITEFLRLGELVAHQHPLQAWKARGLKHLSWRMR